MKISPQVHALLPLRRDSHRLIVSAASNAVCQVQIAKTDTQASIQVEKLIVTAVNAHQVLVAEVKAAEHIIKAMRSVLTLAQKRAVFDQLEAAGVALDGPVRSVERCAALVLAGAT